MLIAASALAALAGQSGTRSAHVSRMGAFTLKSNPRQLEGESSALAVIGQPESARQSELNGAAEDYANRAYPADSIPYDLTANAVAAWDQAVASSKGNTNGKNAAGTWDLVGPDQATYPGVLNRTGSLYHASGRITGLTLKPGCSSSSCELLLAAAGGGIWFTDKALQGQVKWQFVSGSLPTNAIGTLYRDTVNDPTGNTVYAGTGEPNASADSEAGTGIYKSTDGGRTWAPLSSNQTPFLDRSIAYVRPVPGTPSTIYVGTTRGVRGISSVSGGAASLKPGAQAWGVWKTTDGGATWTFLFDGGPTASSCNPPNTTGANNCSARGSNDFAFDPRNSNTVYASLFGLGIWRSDNAGVSWRQIFTPLVPQLTSPFFTTTDRTQFDVTTLASGAVRVYAGDGDVGPDGGEPGQYSRVWRTDDVDSVLPLGNAGWKVLTSNLRTSPYYGTYDYCWAQCWYDNDIVTPKGQPDTVYVLGAYRYDEAGGVSNGRGVVVSYTAGEPSSAFNGGSWADLTRDATPSDQPDGIHPDQHSFALDDATGVWFEGSDGGIMQSDGKYVDDSSECLDRGLAAQDQATCQQLLSNVPHDLNDNLNKGLPTLQFQSVAISQQRPLHQVIGGTQDNGTFDWDGSQAQVWWQTMYGDGGQSGIDATDDSIMFNEFTGRTNDTNFRGGQPNWWVVVSGKFYAPNTNESAPFYAEIQQDPALHGQRFFGMQHVWRTQDNGGDQGYLEANCPEFTTFANDPRCGDFVALGDTNGPPSLRNEPGDLTSAIYGAGRTGGTIAKIGRQRSDATGNVMWVATSTGRVFITANAAAAAPTVTFTRIDDKSGGTSPARFPTGIWVDPANANHAWISYSGYNVNTPSQQGHVFDVTWNGTTAVWRSLNVESGNADYPINDVVRDDTNGNLYAATDFGVLVGQPSGVNYVWTPTVGMPRVEVSGLRIHPEQRVLYAATHGRSIYRMILP